MNLDPELYPSASLNYVTFFSEGVGKYLYLRSMEAQVILNSALIGSASPGLWSYRANVGQMFFPVKPLELGIAFKLPVDTDVILKLIIQQM